MIPSAIFVADQNKQENEENTEHVDNCHMCRYKYYSFVFFIYRSNTERNGLGAANTRIVFTVSARCDHQVALECSGKKSDWLPI